MFLRELVISGRTIKSHRISFSSLISFSLVLVCACASMVGANRQALGSQEPPRQHAPIVGDWVELTALHVSVYDRDGKLVDGLQREAFDIFEDGARQKIAMFSHEDEPATVGLLIDTSGSMTSKIHAATEGVRRFIQVSNPKNNFFAASFGEHVERIATREELDAFLTKPATSGRTAMLDALYLGLVELQSTRNSRKALLIISDGEDNHSRYNHNELRKLAKESGVPIYGLILVGQSFGATQEESSNEPEFLADLCKLSGGKLVQAKALSEVPNLAAEIGIALKKQYLVGYYPTNGISGPVDAHWRKIEVKVQSKGERGPLKIYAPTGYFRSADGNIL